jgi:hypothetical protein
VVAQTVQDALGRADGRGLSVASAMVGDVIDTMRLAELGLNGAVRTAAASALAWVQDRRAKATTCRRGH